MLRFTIGKFAIHSALSFTVHTSFTSIHLYTASLRMVIFLLWCVHLIILAVGRYANMSSKYPPEES